MGFLGVEHMRVPSDHLLCDDIDDLFDAEPLLIPADLSVEHHLQQHIAELLDDRRVHLRVDGFEQFVGLFEREGLDRLQRLLSIPRTTGG